MPPFDTVAPRQRVLQRSSHDCGVACAAMLLGTSYETAQALFEAQGLNRPRKRLAPWSSQVGELEKVLRAGGATVKRQRFTAWDRLETPVIAKVMVTPRGNWHWVVLDRVGAHSITVLDPWPNAQPSNLTMPMSVIDPGMARYRPQGTCLTLVLHPRVE